MNKILIIIFYGLMAGVSSIAGIALLNIKKDYIKKYTSYLMSISAGLLLAVAFVHLIPEAIELNNNSVIFILVGFLVFYIIEGFVTFHSGPELHHFEHAHKDKLKVKGEVSFVGLLFHSLIDGIIIGIGFEIDTKIGLLTSIGIISHELPEGITTFSILMLSISRKKALILSILVAIATPFGAVMSLLFIKNISHNSIGILLALASGSFLYVAASDLIPETLEIKDINFKKRVINICCMISGVLLIYLLSNIH